MAIRAKLVIIFFLIIIVPMFLLWARWQGTALGGVKSVLQQGLSDRAREISAQINRSLQEHRGRITKFAKRPALENYARTVGQGGQLTPDGDLKLVLSAFLLSNQKEYSALTAVNRQGVPLFKIEPLEVDGVTLPVYSDKGFTAEETIRAPETEAFTAATDKIYVSEIHRDGSDPHVKLITPLRDAANNVTSALVVNLRADQLLAAAAGPRVPEKSGPSGESTPMAIILSPKGYVLFAGDASKQGQSYTQAFPDLSPVFAPLLKEKDKDDDRDPWLIQHFLRENNPRLSI